MTFKSKIVAALFLFLGMTACGSGQAQLALTDSPAAPNVTPTVTASPAPAFDYKPTPHGIDEYNHALNQCGRIDFDSGTFCPASVMQTLFLEGKIGRGMNEYYWVKTESGDPTECSSGAGAASIMNWYVTTAGTRVTACVTRQYAYFCCDNPNKPH